MGNNIYLIGFMGVGKSTVSRKLAEAAGYEEIDTDARIARRQGRSVSEIFREKGEAYFRDLETELLEELAGQERNVVSCGGGMALRGENVRLMKRGGAVAWLTASPETVLGRVRRDGSRPLLEGMVELGQIREMMEGRVPYYQKAADGRSPEESAEEILRNIKKLF